MKKTNGGGAVGNIWCNIGIGALGVVGLGLSGVSLGIAAGVSYTVIMGMVSYGVCKGI